jgi:hypothetical protein
LTTLQFYTPKKKRGRKEKPHKLKSTCNFDHNMKFKRLLLFHALFARREEHRKEMRDTGKEGEMACIVGWVVVDNDWRLIEQWRAECIKGYQNGVAGSEGKGENEGIEGDNKGETTASTGV